MKIPRPLLSLVRWCLLLPNPQSAKPSTVSINDKELLVRGWNDTELKQIIDDFEQMYSDHLPPDFSLEIQGNPNDVSRILFPHDIEAALFYWLINYVQYPKDFDLRSRTIHVAGKGTIGSDFLPSEHSLIGKSATFYIPADDQEYDVVYVLVEGRACKYPFSSERWRPAQDPRLLEGIEDLQYLDLGRLDIRNQQVHISHSMTKHQKAFHRTSAIMMLVFGLVLLCLMVPGVVSGVVNEKDAQSVVVIYAIASTIFAAMWIYYWKVGHISIRSVKIERKSEPKTYQIAMIGFLIFILAFLVCLIWSCYVLLTHAA